MANIAAAQTAPPTPQTDPTAPIAAQPTTGQPDAAAPAAAQAGAAPVDSSGLQDIVVTAQRREQRLQDVPIAITALTQEALTVNRVQTVQDLSGLAPNLVVRQAAGSIGIPSFSMRGITSFGVVPGSDKEISIYLDGVYIGSPRGSIFDLPDIARVEVLRGPQGTLFGRNATGGAISVTSREPNGVLGARQEVSFGNFGYVRTRTTVDTPLVGPFSAYGTVLYNTRRGDIRNTGAGTVWDRRSVGQGLQVSPRTLGDKNAKSFFGVLRFEPSDRFNATYKFDYSDDHFTPEGAAAIAVNPAVLPAGGAFLLRTSLAASPGAMLSPSGKRPDAVNNNWSTEGFLRVYGHNVTANFRLTDHLSFKNIAAWRKSYVAANSQLDGLGGLIYPFPPIAGSPFVTTVTQNVAVDKQFSDELQANFTSKLLTMTVGGIYFSQRGTVGGPPNSFNTTSFSVFPGYVIPQGNTSISHNHATSLAAYGQAELHIVSRLDIVGGVRVTRDRKNGDFQRTGAYVNGVPTNLSVSPYAYEKTKPNYSIGLNYKLNSDVLFYGKYSTAFVSGGSIGGVGFNPETVRSFEVGTKADLLDRRLRANVALFAAKYKDIQSAQSGINFGRPDLSTVVITLGDNLAKGAEAELTLLPLTGLTLTAGGGLTDTKYSRLNPVILASLGGDYERTFIPRWTANLSGEYRTQPVFGSARVLLHLDASWRDTLRFQTNGQIRQSPAFAPVAFSSPTWIVNGRLALTTIEMGPASGEIAMWVRNLTDDKSPTFPLNFGGYVISSTFQRARTFGADFSVKF